MNNLLDSIGFLEFEIFGNRFQDYLISAALFLAVFLIGELLVQSLRKRLLKGEKGPGVDFRHMALRSLFALLAGLVPVAAFAVAKRSVYVDERISPWMDKILLICSGMIAIFVLLQFFHGIVEFLAGRHLERIGQADPNVPGGQKESVEQIKEQTKAMLTGLLILIAVLTILSNIGTDLEAMWIILGCVVIIAVGVFLRLILALKRDIKLAETTLPQEASPSVHAVRKGLRLTGEEEIARFFLNIYKFQLGATERAPGQFRLADRQPLSGGDVYELRVRIKKQWLSRRMTIGRLGEGVGSKSRCFYVIYDDYRVIKIPQMPLNDFSEYVDNIRKERRIAEKLSPRQCTVPMISPILKSVHVFPDGAGLTPEQLDERYIRWLSRFDNFQRCLRIGDSFAFYMDLSKGYFLSRIIDMLHNSEARIYKEITNEHNPIWDSIEFRNRYGHEALPNSRKLQAVYVVYENFVNKLLMQSAVSFPVLPYQIKKWFLAHLAGKEVSGNERGLSSELLSELNRFARQLLMDNSATVEAYREVIKKYVSSSSLAKNKPEICAIVTNLLFLIAWLREKGVAVRDLKPDNCFAAAGDPSRYPLFLTSPEEYEIGLIDLETAVDFGRRENKYIPQPLLGGTSRFATPSHFFVNDILFYNYGDLANIFHLQDWHAVLGMIYNAVTGYHLFDKTSKLISSISQMVIRAAKEGQNMFDIFKSVSTVYWNSAIAEFNLKLEEKEEMLKSIEPIVPENAKELISMYILNERQSLLVAIRDCVNSQTIFDQKQDRDHLLVFSSKMISQLIKKWEYGVNVPEAPEKDRAQIIGLLRVLERIKLQSEQVQKIINRFEQPMPTVSAYDLLQVMFRVILKYMHKEDWGALSGDETSSLGARSVKEAWTVPSKRKYALNLDAFSVGDESRR